MQHVFFDLDGTLTDSAEGIVRCMQHAVRTLGGEPPSHERGVAYIGTPLDTVFREVLATQDDARVARAVELYVERFRGPGIRENRLYPGAKEALGALRSAGLSLRLATAKKQESAEDVVGLFELGSYFDGVHGLNLAAGGDKGALLREVVATHGLDASACTMVGDRFHDIAAARASGMRAIAVTWGYAGPGEFRDAVPDATVGDFSQLVALLAPAEAARN